MAVRGPVAPKTRVRFSPSTLTPSKMVWRNRTKEFDSLQLVDKVQVEVPKIPKVSLGSPSTLFIFRSEKARNEVRSFTAREDKDRRAK